MMYFIENIKHNYNCGNCPCFEGHKPLKKIIKKMTTENKKAKLVTVESNNRNFELNGKTFYEFTISFDNGDKGKANSTFETPKWEIGEEYSYLKTQREYQGKRYSHFSKLSKEKGNKFYVAGAGYKSKEEWLQHAYQVAIEISTEIYSVDTPFVVEYNKKYNVVDLFYKWITDNVNNDFNLYWMAFSTLRSAIAFSKNPTSNINDSNDLLKLATELFNKCKEIKE